MAVFTAMPRANDRTATLVTSGVCQACGTQA